jgi:hypothetical protein
MRDLIQNSRPTFFTRSMALAMLWPSNNARDMKKSETIGGVTRVCSIPTRRMTVLLGFARTRRRLANDCHLYVGVGKRLVRRKNIYTTILPVMNRRKETATVKS